MAAPDDHRSSASKRERGGSRNYNPRNLILAALPPSEDKILESHLQEIPLSRGETLLEAGQPIPFGYFPNSGLISLLLPMQDGATVEMSVTGREGFLGIPILLGMDTSLLRAIVQIEGIAFRIQADVLRRVLPTAPKLAALLRRWLQVRIVEIAQFAGCNSLHRIGQRLSRLLLTSSLRAESDVLPLTQDMLAQMLGCRRPSVTAAARELQSKGAIDYSRGRLQILNRKILAAASCECYAIVRHNSSKLTTSP